MNHGLRRNYAAVTMDGGHWGATRWDASWIHVKDPIARFDFAQRAVTETAQVNKEVIAAYYGKPPGEIVLRRLLHRRPPGEHGSLEVPGGLRRHHQRVPLALRLAGHRRVGLERQGEHRA